MAQTAGTSAWIESLIKDFIDNSPENSLQNENREKAFETPLVGFSRGDDPLYEAFREHVGPFHLTPQEIFSLPFSDSRVAPGELTVISWILPQTRTTKSDNSRESVYPAERCHPYSGIELKCCAILADRQNEMPDEIAVPLSDLYLPPH